MSKRHAAGFAHHPVGLPKMRTRMARRRYQKNEGLLDRASRSDWKFSALLAGGCLFGEQAVPEGAAQS